MKWRIKRKKIKKHHICDMWLKSSNNWSIILNKIEFLYTKGIDINNYLIYTIGCDMLRYDWNQYLIEGKKIGFGYRDMNHYACEKSCK